jgi:hypothetical protein
MKALARLLLGWLAVAAVVGMVVLALVGIGFMFAQLPGKGQVLLAACVVGVVVAIIVATGD